MQSLYPYRTVDRSSLAFVCAALALVVGGALFFARLRWNIDLASPWIVGVAIIVGTPHGAADAWLLMRTFSKVPMRAGVFALYIGVALLLLAAGVLWPRLAWGLLLLMSVWHFGERDRKSSNWIATLSLGVTIVASMLASALRGQSFFAGSEACAMGFAVLALVGASFIAFRAVRRGGDAYADLTIAVTVLVLHALLPALAAFVVYFATIHALEHYVGLARMASLQKQATTLFGYAVAFSILAFVMTVLFFGLPQDVHAGGSASTGMERNTVLWMSGFFCAFTFPHLMLLSLLRLRGGGAVGRSASMR